MTKRPQNRETKISKDQETKKPRDQESKRWGSLRLQGTWGSLRSPLTHKRTRESEGRQGKAWESKVERENARETTQKKVPDNMQKSEARESKGERWNARKSKGNQSKARQS